MATPVDGTVEQIGDLKLTSPWFEDGDQMPDSVGFANDNVNPPLQISGVPDGTESFVLIMDDPDAQPVAGHTWDHWLVWDIDPDTREIPEGWDPEADGATVGYTDFVEQGYGGPSPPDASHDYHFKLFALDSKLELPPQARKQRIGSAISMGAEILGATQLIGSYHPDQGTAF